MTDGGNPAVSPAVRAALQGEYLDLMLCAGRLARREISSSDGSAATKLRQWVTQQLAEIRQKLELRHFAGAPAALVEAEIAIVAFLDNAATGAFGLQVWRHLREDYRNDYIEAGRQARSVVDLGKYVYERLEMLRARPDLLSREPDEVLEVYDRLWRLGYLFSYENRASQFEDIKAKIVDELRRRERVRRGAQPALTNPLEADPLLSPHLPALQGSAQHASPLNLMILSGLFLALTLLAGLGLTAVLYRDRRQTEGTLRAAKAKIEGYFYNVDRICQPPAAQHAMTPRRAVLTSQRRARKRSHS